MAQKRKARPAAQPKGKAKGKGKPPRRAPLTAKERALLKYLRQGLSGADAALKAGYQCNSRHSAAATAHCTVKRLTGRPVFRDALQQRGVNLDVVADYVKDALEGKSVTQIFDVKPDPADPTKMIRVVTQIIEKDDGRSRAQALRWIMEAFEATVSGEADNPWDGVSDDDLEAMVAAGVAEAPGAGQPGAAPA